MTFDRASVEGIDPWFRWVGGKRWLLGRISNLIPREVTLWVEDFFGGGSVYLGLAPGCPAELSDGNRHLVDAWIGLKEDWEAVAVVADRWRLQHEQDPVNTWKRAKLGYLDYSTKHGGGPTEAAGWFCYAQQVAINGLYRMNRSRELNAALGKDSKTGIPHQVVVDRPHLRKVHRALARAELRWLPIDSTNIHALSDHGPGTVIIEDPPYLGTFNNYTHLRFEEADHILLEQYLRRQAENDATVIVSNSVDALDLYRGPFWSHEIVNRKGTMSAGKDRKAVGEALIWRKP